MLRNLLVATRVVAQAQALRAAHRALSTSETTPSVLNRHRCFDGEIVRYSHQSDTLKCGMNFAVVLPPSFQPNEQLPVLYWLSGLTCTEENFVIKAGASQWLRSLRCIIVCPDTSPRGVNLPGENDSYDFGSGAGFYLNATQEPWGKHYHMEDYVVAELPSVVNRLLFPSVDSAHLRRSVFGHSMGGHGALTLALRHPDKFVSVSAFAPIAHPSECPWGQKAFTGYLGASRDAWKAHDATELIKAANRSLFPSILIDQGLEDEFLTSKQLLPHDFVHACSAARQKLEYHERAGYNHSYFFIQSFLQNHLQFHLDAHQARK